MGGKGGLGLSKMKCKLCAGQGSFVSPRILAWSLGSGTIWSPVLTEMENGISRSNTAAFVGTNQQTEKLKMKGK